MSDLAIVFAVGLAVAGMACLVWGIWRMARPKPDGGMQEGQSGLSGGAFGVQVTVNGPWPLVVSGFGAAMLIVAAVLVTVPLGNSPATSSASPPRVSPSSAAVSPAARTSASACTTKLRITSPAGGTKISGPQGVLIKGRSCDLVNDDGWLFDFDYHDHYYHEDYSQSPGPVILSDGSWTFLDQPVGSKGDKDVPYSVTLMLADQQCNAALLAAKPVGGDYRFKAFPVGCRIVDSRNVYVTWP